MAYNSTVNYVNLVHQLADQRYHVPDHIRSSFMGYAKSVFQSDVENRYSEPMVWIGVYIALASLCCILAMVADLVHGLRSRKLYIPSKYFAINSASLTVIAVAMKLPVDLTGPMPGVVDQLAKLGSMAFMCTMMANLLPSLATMNSHALLANVVALGVMVITLVVNVCIQIKTGVVVSRGGEAAKLLQMISTGDYVPDEVLVSNKVAGFTLIAIIYSALLLFLLIIYVCSYIEGTYANPIFERRYQQGHEHATEDIGSSTSTSDLSTLEKLEQHVTKYWIMTKSRSPQYLYSLSVTTPASVVICAFVTILHILSIKWAIADITGGDYDSDYKWTTLLILIIQFIGVVLSTVAPLSRCIANLSLLSDILSHTKVFKVEKFWTQKLYDWKYGSISLRFRSPKLKMIIINLRSLILNICIIFQEAVVVVCKIIRLIPLCVLCCLRYFKRWLQSVSNKTKADRVTWEQAKYVLQLEDEIEVAEKTTEALLKSFRQLLQISRRKRPKKLLWLISEKSTEGFQGVRRFNNGDHRTCWSLEVVTLTTIAITLCNIHKHEVDHTLHKTVRKGLEYVTLVEKFFNDTDHHSISFQKAAEKLWQEVDVFHKWLGIRLKTISSQSNMKIVQLFSEKAEYLLKKLLHEDRPDKPSYTSICANSMARVTEILVIHDRESDERLYDELSSRIADIMAACLTNLPRVIAMKCHASVIEKREASVRSVAKLLGETEEIIKTIQQKSADAHLAMNSDDLPYIDKWRAYLRDT